MNLINWSPFQDTNGLFDRYFNLRDALPATEAGASGAFQWRPVVDISETPKHYVIKVELPEVDKEDVDVTVENGLLTISGERRYENEEEDETRHRVERMYGRFSRSFALPPDIDEQAISAKTRNGLLKVRIPKAEAVTETAKRINID